VNDGEDGQCGGRDHERLASIVTRRLGRTRGGCRKGTTRRMSGHTATRQTERSGSKHRFEMGHELRQQQEGVPAFR